MTLVWETVRPELVKNSNPSSSHRDNIMYMCAAEPTPSPYLYVTWKGTHTRRGEKGFISSSSMYPPARNHLFPCETQHVESSSSISKLRSNPTGLQGLGCWLPVADCTTLQAETCTVAYRRNQEIPWFQLPVFSINKLIEKGPGENLISIGYFFKKQADWEGPRGDLDFDWLFFERWTGWDERSPLPSLLFFLSGRLGVVMGEQGRTGRGLRTKTGKG